jgi:hypothetical protein
MTVTLVITRAGAQEVPPPDTSNWKCEQCPFARGHRGEYDVGASYVSDDAARYGNATGYDEEGGYVVAAGTASYASDTYRAQWELEDLGVDSRSVAVEGGGSGTYGYRLEYSELPYRRYDTTQTVFRRATDELLELPEGWVPAGTTDGFAALDASLVDATGETYSRSPPMELDLRNGIDETAYLYFGGFNNFSVGWQFEGGATCSSAQVTFIDVRLSLPDDTQVFGSGAPCQAMFLYANAPEGVYNVDVFAVDNNGSTVASAPRIEGVELTFDRVTDLGIVTLAPCGDQCP